MRYSKIIDDSLHPQMNASAKTILITGGAKRIGRQMALSFHEAGHNVMIHYRSSANAAGQLAESLNAQRADSAATVQADLLDTESLPKVVDACLETFGQLDALVNNASSFYPTPIELIEEDFWNDLVGSNLKAPAFLAKYAAKPIRERNGSIINIVDIHARKPMANHPIYCSAKAGLEMLTKALARDLAPEIRVNAVSPGAILWPEQNTSEEEQLEILNKVPLGRPGDPTDIANMVLFLIDQASYVTGQVIAVDGGRSVII